MNSPAGRGMRRGPGINGPPRPSGSTSARNPPQSSVSSPSVSARRGSPPSPVGPKRSTAPSLGSSSERASRTTSSAGNLSRGLGYDSADGVGSTPISRASSSGDCRREQLNGNSGSKDQRKGELGQQEGPGLFHVIQQLAAAENALWNILDGLKSNTTHASFFCREYWGCSCSQAQLSLERLLCNERLKRQVQQACVLESLSLAVAAQLCSGVMQNISVTIRSRLRNLLYYIHENCLVLLDMVCQRWLLENQSHWQESSKTGHCPENLNLDILVHVKRYRRLRRGEHVMALRQHNEMIVNVVRQLCRGAAPKRPPLSSRGSGGPTSSTGSVGVRSIGGSSREGLGSAGPQQTALNAVNEILTARMPLDRLKASTIRSKMLQYMCFKPLLNVDGSDECPWPMEDPYMRYGADQFAQDGPTIWFEPLPPMLPDLEQVPKLPPAIPDAYTLVLDLDETLVHYFELDGVGQYGIRPGMLEFLERMSQLGYELVIFTAATQDYADWVIDQIDPNRLIHHRLYRQHALPWGPIFVKDLSRLGRELDRTLIIDNVQENFMLQPHNGIFICTWYDDPQDTALFALTPLLDELIATRTTVPEILDKYRDQIPTWAGFDQFSQFGGEYSSDFDPANDDAGLGTPGDPMAHAVPYQSEVEPVYTHNSPIGVSPPMPPQSFQQQVPQVAAEFHSPMRDLPDDHYGSAAVGTTQPSHSVEPPMSLGARPSAPSPYASKYQPAQSHASATQPQYLNTAATHWPATGGYPQPSQPSPQTAQIPHGSLGRAGEAQKVPQHGAPQQRPQPVQLQAQSGLTAPQGAPRHQVAPAFSGIAGPYQAPAPGAPAGAAAMWSRAGPGVGPHQAPPPTIARRR